MSLHKFVERIPPLRGVGPEEWEDFRMKFRTAMTLCELEGNSAGMVLFQACDQGESSTRTELENRAMQGDQVTSAGDVSTEPRRS